VQLKALGIAANVSVPMRPTLGQHIMVQSIYAAFVRANHPNYFDTVRTMKSDDSPIMGIHR